MLHEVAALSVQLWLVQEVCQTQTAHPLQRGLCSCGFSVNMTTNHNIVMMSAYKTHANTCSTVMRALQDSGRAEYSALLVTVGNVQH